MANRKISLITKQEVLLKSSMDIQAISSSCLHYPETCSLEDH